MHREDDRTLSIVVGAIIVAVVVGVGACNSLLGTSGEVSALGVDVKASSQRPWVPNPAPTVIASVVVICPEADPIVHALGLAPRDAGAER